MTQHQQHGQFQKPSQSKPIPEVNQRKDLSLYHPRFESQNTNLNSSEPLGDDYNQDDDLVPVSQRVNRVVLPNTSARSTKRRIFIDLTDPEEGLNKNSKKFKGDKLKIQNTDPFLKLGEEVNRRVEEMHKKCQVQFNRRLGHSNSSMQTLHRNIKKLISKYLLYGIEECNLRGVTHRYATSEEEDIVKVVIGFAESIQAAVFKRNLNNQKGYQNQCQLIIQNLKDFSNFQLREKVLNLSMTAQMLSSATQNDMDPAERKKEREEKRRYLLAEANLYREKIGQSDTPNEKDNQEPGFCPERCQEIQIQPKKKNEMSELRKAISHTKRRFYERIQADLPAEIGEVFCEQLNSGVK